MTFDDVIEKHRLAAGASSLRVSLAPAATPEGLDAELERLGAISAAYDAFRPEEIEAAKVARLRKLLREIHVLAAQGATDRIVDLTGLVVNVDLDQDLAWMRAAREKRSEPLPAITPSGA
ncbi:hypothetical protein OCH239_09145 [Roseivivax halodurans JCM 10272]|uniref:Uncharacterized protein n=1 Tax=Roseivivax halodurans JCM 10272 TaxID=1449350 RepID=X7EC15_9RHOB|nr:hypothetical protein [Roseivivax halodurans]ETX13644.1 hypothetical protein OCH239_09145 [Roseivivax halodurans JCM 10272]